MLEVKVTVRGIQMSVKMSGQPSQPTFVFLHGFTGSTETWTEVIDSLKGNYHVVCIDCIGHGQTDAPNDPNRYKMVEQIEDLEVLFNQLNLHKFTLIGYSMGGRLAIGYSLTYPNRIKSLILESSSPGLITEDEQEERRAADQKLAARIVENGIEKFVEFWENIPLFHSQKRLPAEKQQSIREERLSQNPIGLSNSLLGMGTGSQPSYWGKLPLLTFPVLLITGEFDKKFVTIAREMKKQLPDAKIEMVVDVGHAIHVEKPLVFATMIEEYIKVFTNQGGSL